MPYSCIHEMAGNASPGLQTDLARSHDYEKAPLHVVSTSVIVTPLDSTQRRLGRTITQPNAFSNETKGEARQTSSNHNTKSANQTHSMCSFEKSPSVLKLVAARMFWPRKGPDICGDIRLLAAWLHSAYVEPQCLFVLRAAFKPDGLWTRVRMAEGREAYGRLRSVRRPWA